MASAMTPTLSPSRVCSPSNTCRRPKASPSDCWPTPHATRRRSDATPRPRRTHARNPSSKPSVPARTGDCSPRPRKIGSGRCTSRCAGFRSTSTSRSEPSCRRCCRRRRSCTGSSSACRLPHTTSVVRVDHFEMASRLSYFLWGTMPDALLFAAAQAGQLGTPAEVRAQAQRMLGDPRAREVVSYVN